MTTIIDDGGSHYYTQTGAPRYGATLREARKHNYFPSITTVLKDWPAGFLREWIRNEERKAQHNNPPEGEAAEPIVDGEKMTDAQRDHFQRIQGISTAIRDEAADRGNELHDGAEAMLCGREWNTDDVSLKHLRQWLDVNLEEVYWTERSLVSLDLRLAGRADALIKTKGDERPLLIDFKGRGFDHGPRKGWKAKKYDKDIVQLAFYASTMTDPPRIANLYIHRDGACPVEVAEYTDDQRKDAFRMCEHATAIWFYVKKYSPEINHDELVAHFSSVINMEGVA